MKDLAQLAIYAALTVGAILLLIAMSDMEGLSSSVVVITALLLVVVLPVVIGIKAAKREQAQKNK